MDCSTFEDARRIQPRFTVQMQIYLSIVDETSHAAVIKVTELL